MCPEHDTTHAPLCSDHPVLHSTAVLAPAAVHVTDCALATVSHASQVSDAAAALLSVRKKPGLQTARLSPEAVHVTDAELATLEHGSQDCCSIESAPKVLVIEAA